MSVALAALVLIVPAVKVTVLAVKLVVLISVNVMIFAPLPNASTLPVA